MKPVTRFDQYLRRRQVSKSALAERSGYSRVHITNVAKGRTEPSRPFMDSMVEACTALSGEAVSRDDLFEFRPRARRRKAS